MKKTIQTACLAVLLATGAAHAGDLQVELNLPANRQGVVAAAIFNQSEGFPHGKPLRTATAQPDQGKATIQFLGLPDGDYVITAFLDENGNTALDKNMFGLPTELYGFSRNARKLTGPPAFADALFHVKILTKAQH